MTAHNLAECSSPRSLSMFLKSKMTESQFALKALESCRGEVVKTVLDEAKARTGEVIAIVSDQGSELKKGIRLFQEEQTEKPVHLYDIMHKVDLVLKKELENDIEWQKFLKELTNTTQQLKLSASSHLIYEYKRSERTRLLSENIDDFKREERFDIVHRTKFVFFFKDYRNNRRRNKKSSSRELTGMF